VLRSYHWLDGQMGSKPVLLMVAALVFFLANTLPDFCGHSSYGKQVDPQDMVRVLLLVVPLLHGGSGCGGAGWSHQPARRLADLPARAAADLLGVPLLSALSGRLEAEKDRVEIEKRHVEKSRR
jgi:hypothetical protein